MGSFKLTALGLALLIANTAAAVDCPSANYTLITRADVNALGASGCDTITGDMSVSGSSEIYNLEPLVGIFEIKGALTISGNAGLLNLDGLLNVTTAGTVAISENTVMTNIEGLKGLKQVGGLSIASNPVLRDIEGLRSLVATSGDLSVSSNPLIQNFEGLRSLVRVGGALTIEGNDALVHLDGLSKLTQIGSALTIKDNRALINIDGLSNLNALTEVIVSASASQGGSISPAFQRVLPGLSAQFTVSADAGYSVSDIGGTCPSGSFDGTTYTTGALATDCTVIANFTDIVSFTVTASATTGGTISPSFRTVQEGDTASFTVTPDDDYSLGSIGGTCPSGALSGTDYITGGITADCAVIANFSTTNPSGYCEGAPSGVVCDPNADGWLQPGGTMDSWAPPTWGFAQAAIPFDKIVAFPFLANGGASIAEGTMEFSNNMPGLPDDYAWKGWFSETPGGAVLNNNSSYCRKYSANPNPQEMRWSQKANPSRFNCALGQAERVLYFNMEIGCYAELSSDACTVGEPFPGFNGFSFYYVRVYPR